MSTIGRERERVAVFTRSIVSERVSSPSLVTGQLTRRRRRTEVERRRTGEGRNEKKYKEREHKVVVGPRGVETGMVNSTEEKHGRRRRRRTNEKSIYAAASSIRVERSAGIGVPRTGRNIYPIRSRIDRRGNYDFPARISLMARDPTTLTR